VATGVDYPVLRTSWYTDVDRITHGVEVDLISLDAGSIFDFEESLVSL